MKLIITESQYKELYKLDDVYDGLDPYYRRRVKYIDIKDDIDRSIGFRSMNVFKKSPRGIDGHLNDIIHRVAWETVSDEWNESADDKLVTYVYEMMDRINKKYGNYIREKLLQILENENNNN